MSLLRFAFLFFILVLFSTLLTSLQTMPKITYSFGICLKPNYPENLITYAVIKEKDGKRLDIRKTNARSFALMAGGFMKSEANMEQVNFFEEFDIPYCDLSYDTVMTNHVVVCPILNRLWKLRHQFKPGNFAGGTTENAADMGWSAKAHSPSEDQLKMLAAFGMETINQYAKGKDCFNLLKAVSDPNWVSAYKGN